MSTRIMHFFGVGCFLLLCTAPVHAENQSAAAISRLRKLKNDLQAERQALRTLDREERSLLLAVTGFDRTLHALQEEREQAQARVASLRESLGKRKARIEEDESRLKELQKRLVHRLRALYVLGEGAELRALLGAQSFEDLAWRRKLIGKLANHDARLVRDHQNTKSRLLKNQALLLEEIAEAEGTEKELNEQVELLSTSQTERRELIAKIESEKELRVRVVTEIVQQQKELRALIWKLRGPEPVKKRGRGILQEGLMWPLRGTLVRRFGMVREAETGARLVSNGIHIRVPIGTPVRATAAGKVAYVGWMRGFGQLVILDHGSGHHTLSAHLSKTQVSQGQRVDKGQILGASGDTGSLSGAKLYFELRDEGRPINPVPYMR